LFARQVEIILNRGVDPFQPLGDTTVTTEPFAIEFWFDFGSNYSYLSVMRIEEAAREKGVPIIWKAFLLGPIFRVLGMANSPFVLQKEKGAYVWRDMERQCRKFVPSAAE
jgi:2-hydroxychromene-2-carboxylate isomerase